MNLPKRAQIVMSFWEGGVAAENDSKEIYDWKTSGAEGREKTQMERENEFIHGVQRGDIFEVSRSEENFIMTDNRDRDE